jgi:hypothetical protein
MSVQLAGVAVATLTFATFPLFTVILEAAMQRLALVVTAAVLINLGLSLAPKRSQTVNEYRKLFEKRHGVAPLVTV